MIEVEGSANIIFNFSSMRANRGKTSTTKVSQLLPEDFACNIGFPALQFNESNTCWLELAGKHIICITTQSELNLSRLRENLITQMLDYKESIS